MTHYLCDIIGTGTEDDPFRPAIDAYGVKWSCIEDRRADDTVGGGKMLVGSDADPALFAGDDRVVAS